MARAQATSDSAATAPREATAPADLLALRAAVEALHAASFGWAMTCTGRRRHEAEDVLQTAYVKVLGGRARFEGRSSFRTWLFGVIRVTALEQRRGRWLAVLGLGPGAAAAHVASEARPADAALAQDQQTRAVARAVARLAERQRAVLHLVFYEDMTVRDAAEVMGISVGAASVHYDRGKKNLAALLRDEGVER